MGCGASTQGPPSNVDPPLPTPPPDAKPSAPPPPPDKPAAKPAATPAATPAPLESGGSKGTPLAKPGQKGKYDMQALFAQFDADGDGKLDIYEIARAFRALGLPKRSGEKMDIDKATFKSFDTNGDGYVTMEELDANLYDKTREKIEACIDKGWKFDKKTWDESVARHKKYDMKQIFAQFDADGDGKLDIYEIARAFRAMGLPKRDGEKMEMDKAMFKSFDTDGDGFVDMRELDENLKPKTRKKIEQRLEDGWTFDKERR
eukprot:CAMPEP_0174694224 /NCGR_PEP_ID=MMETSP1094-20130205/833_1 /TAXON_ID=156173 /ORGANISM="Chrysochromulina brevifilum, Strain UTEX LB 985" /LENGTH=259 /DNA_ID=CAMNT_0015890381 /DNA_START=58 /DNA_END=833 /DNA_ORIENTATION=+